MQTKRAAQTKLASWLAVIWLALLHVHVMLLPAEAADQRPAQPADAAYRFENTSPAWQQNAGPRVILHRYVSPYVQRGSMEPFETLVRTDGFKFDWVDVKLTADVLDSADILVVANPYLKGGRLDYRNFSTLEAPSVYSDDEIAMIHQWVDEGGALLVLADHSPFAGGAIKLMNAFGYTPMTGFAIHRKSLASWIMTDVDFRREGSGDQVGSLAAHPITDGKLGRARIDHFFTFGGQAVIPSSTATSLLNLPSDFESILTFDLQGDFDTALRIDASGFSQGAVEEVGRGRIAFFGETGAFTAQYNRNGTAFGLSVPEADQNADFVLSVLRWLARYEP